MIFFGRGNKGKGVYCV